MAQNHSSELTFALLSSCQVDSSRPHSRQPTSNKCCLLKWLFGCLHWSMIEFSSFLSPLANGRVRPLTFGKGGKLGLPCSVIHVDLHCQRVVLGMWVLSCSVPPFFLFFGGCPTKTVFNLPFKGSLFFPGSLNNSGLGFWVFGSVHA